MDISHIRAVIFDMDGVFFDTEPLMFEAFRRVFKLHGLDLSDEYQYKFIGYPTIKNLQDICQDFHIELDMNVSIRKLSEAYMEILKETDLQAQDGVWQLVDFCKAQNKKIALCTTSSKESVNKNFENIFKHKSIYMLDTLFDAIITGEDVTHQKPHPDPYQKAAQLLNLEPRQCLVIEDSTSGIQSASAAGCFCIGFRQPYSQSMDFSKADAVINSFHGLVGCFNFS